MMVIEGNVRKMNAENKTPIQYSIVLSGKNTPINEHIGSSISLKWNGIINCVRCGNQTQKSFFQGFCYPCFINAPESSECILKPELCQAHEGISRDMEWAERHCLSDHYVYLSLTSGIKVGVTRHTQIPTRWIDQGAIKALKIAKTPNRYLAGVIEVALKKFVSDRTAWQRMLKNEVLLETNLYEYREKLKNELNEELGVNIEIGNHLSTIEHDYGPMIVRIAFFSCSFDGQNVISNVHDECRWISESEANLLNWLPADIEFVNHLVEGRFETL